MLRVSLILTLLLLSNVVIADAAQTRAHKHLDTIQKFLHVAPERSRAVMTNNQESTAHLDVDKKIQWYTAGATIGLKLNDLILFESSLKNISTLINAKNLTLNQNSSLTLLGHYSLKVNLLNEAKTSYNCLYSIAETQSEKIRAAYRVANAFLSEGDLDNAKLIMTQLLRIAVNQDNQAWLGPIKSTMGIYALYNKEYLVAEKFFTESMLMHQEQQNYSGEFNSLLNLLLTFLLSDSEKYVRIEHRVVRLSQKNEDVDRHMLLKLIQLVRAQRFESGNKKYQTLARQYFGQISSSTVKKAAIDFVMPELKIATQERLVTRTPAWIGSFLAKLECQARPTDLNNMLEELSKI